MHTTSRARGRTSTVAALRIGALASAAALLTLGLAPASATASTTPGTWEFHPGQTYTDITTSSYTTAYKTAVRPPINADGSSNFPAKRGVIPMQFDLLAATATTMTTTRTYDPPVWKSIGSEGSVTYATFTPSSSMTFAGVWNLSAIYAFTEGDCAGGSLRWTINVHHGTTDTNVYAYYGNPNGPDQGCSNGSSGSGDNLVATGIVDNRFEVQGLTSYTDYDTVSAIVGSDPVNWVSLQLDSGWKLDQKANVSDVTVNDNTWAPKTTEVLRSTEVTGDYAKTCDLPPAEITVTKNDGTPTGAVNEVDSIQPKDSGVYYRQVDCKYIYNLDVSTLSGSGSYTVGAVIADADLPGPATFDLK